VRWAPLAAAALLAGFSPLQAEEGNVRVGNEALTGGDAAAALSRYDAAERARGPHAEIDYDRGNALYRLGRTAEARDAWRRALERDRGALSSRALQNLGNGLDALGDRDGAVTALRESLVRDPANDDARYNLEVMLRRKAEGKGAPRDPGPGGARGKEDASARPRGGASDPSGAGGQREPEAPQGGGEARPPERRDGGGKRAGESGSGPEGRAGGREEAGEGGAKQEARAGEGAGQPAAASQQDGERLLDALRARERDAPLWSPLRRETRRRDVAKDW
jgi:Ca-activated chloride channel family protein